MPHCSQIHPPRIRGNGNGNGGGAGASRGESANGHGTDKSWTVGDSRPCGDARVNSFVRERDATNRRDVVQRHIEPRGIYHPLVYPGALCLRRAVYFLVLLFPICYRSFFLSSCRYSINRHQRVHDCSPFLLLRSRFSLAEVRTLTNDKRVRQL